MKQILKQIAQQTLPVPIHNWLLAQVRAYRHNPPLGKVNFGELRRLTPIESDWGFDRSFPVHRYYLKRFLFEQAEDIRGHTLETEDGNYTHQFGRARVTKSDLLHLNEGNPYATIFGDLTCPDQFPADTYDCVLLTQTLQLIYDLPAAVKTLYRILKPGGVVLATMPGLSRNGDSKPEQIADFRTCNTDNWSDYWCWSFTTVAAKRLFAEAFGAANVEVKSYGNVLSAIAALQGMATQELTASELDYCDPVYQVLITVRAVKPKES
ncbi:MAG TPA: methyltransferase [Cyanobacteria bacterium UBA11049]|nr:methyltransferase [Cyanobacteria bacterium UBA11049]